MLLLVVALLTSAPDAGCEPCASFRSPAAAFGAVLARHPVILAVGEYHEVRGAPKVPSAIHRFTTELLPRLKGIATSLIVETWMLSGRCGEVERRAVAAVDETTQRPQSTEDEVTSLLYASHALGLKNHTLLLGCEDYRAMVDDAGSLDAEASLLLVERKVRAKAGEVQERGEGGVPGRLLVLYGGALHNDLMPLEAYRAFSFGPALARQTDGPVVELDLLVPEYVESDDDLQKEPWFAAALALSSAGRTVLVNPAPGVYRLLFPRSARPRAPSRLPGRSEASETAASRARERRAPELCCPAQ